MAKIIKAAGTVKRVGPLAFILKNFFLILFLSYLIIHAVGVGIEEKSIEATYKLIGKELINPVISAQEFAIKIQENPPNGIFSSLWTYWGFYYALYWIYLWLWLIKKGIDFFMEGTNQPFFRWAWAIFIFLLILITYLALSGFKPDDLLQAFKDIGRAAIVLYGSSKSSFGLE